MKTLNWKTMRGTPVKRERASLIYQLHSILCCRGQYVAQGLREFSPAAHISFSASPSDLIQHGEDAHRLARRHLTCRAVMDMIREAWETGEMRRVIPTRDELIVGIGPVIAIGDHHNLSSRGSLHIFGKLELAAIGQRESSTQIAVHQR